MLSKLLLKVFRALETRLVLATYKAAAPFFRAIRFKQKLSKNIRFWLNS